MGYNDPDVYNQPEALNLKLIGALHDPSAYYDFDMLIVLQHVDGRLFYACDSGCSCPSPFEDFTTLESLTPITADNWPNFARAVLEHADYEPNQEDTNFAADKTQLLAEVARLL